MNNEQAKVQATEAVWQQFHGCLKGFIRRRIANEHDAEDILQEVFLRIHANLPQLETSENVNAWVYRIARNAITDHYRSRQKEANILVGAAKTGDEGQDKRPVDDYTPEERADLGRCMNLLIERLPDEHGEALLLTEVAGHSQKELAEKIGISVSGMKSRVQRGRAQLKGLLNDCCQFEFDGRGNVIDVERRRGPGDDCACGGSK